MSALHLPTLLVANGVICAMLALLCWSAVRALPLARESLRCWAGALAALAVATPLFVLREQLPLLLGVGLANALTLYCAAAMAQAYGLAIRGARPRGWRRGLLLIGGLAPLCLALGMPMERALLTIPMAVALALLAIAWQLGRLESTKRDPAVAAAMVCFLIAGGVWGSRAVLALADREHALLRVDEPTVLQVMAFLCGVGVVVLGTLGLFALLYGQQRSQLEERAARDKLTGLLNRGAFFDQARAQLARSEGESALLMIDIDHFKRINDQHGHQVGDWVIAHAARLIATNVRLQDLAGRYGGEEFLVLLKDGSGAEAQRLAQRLIGAAAQTSLSLRDGRSVGFTMSVGYVVGRGDLDGLIAAADAALYAAKAAGRNQAMPARLGWQA